MSQRFPRRSLLALAALLLVAGQGACAPLQGEAAPRQLTVLVSGAYEPALRKLAPAYERSSHTRLVIVTGPSMGATVNAIPQRLDRGEPADVVILAREALDRLAKAGKVHPDSARDLVLSRIAMAVKEGAPAPDISTVTALRQTLLDARSVAYSDSASGVFLSTKLFAELGVAEAMAGKARMIPATPVGEIVAHGEAEIGFQQLSELKAVTGIRIVGLLPEDAQKVTRFTAGVVSYSTQHDRALDFIAFLRSPRSREAIVESGLEPVP
jgi:molybdate transport system substrate-binding protein